jgi:hypothetical protein
VRPGRSAHDAGRPLAQSVQRGEVRCSCAAALVSFFDRWERPEFKKRRAVWGADGALWRLMGHCLHVGGLAGEGRVEPEGGPVQGAVLSPWLGHSALPYGLDRGFAPEGKPRLRGQTPLSR